MRTILGFGSLLGVIALIATEANAQRPFGGGGMMGGAGNIGLLTNKGVQEELKITDEQKEKVIEKSKGMGAKFQETFAKLKDVPKEDRPEKMQKAFKDIQESVNKELAEILKPEQMKRLRQIERQQNVANALMNDEDVKKQLKITEEQSAKIKSISEETNKEVGDLFKQFNKENPRETQEKIASLRKEGGSKAVAVLDDEQKSKWKELVGDPYEVKWEGRFPK